jgi:hypothetical protein
MRNFFKKLIYIVASIFILSIVAFFTWATFDYKVDKDQLAKAMKNDRLVIVNTNDYISIQPIKYTGKIAYIFYPGAKVQPEAYIPKLSSISSSNNIKIFIPKFFKNLAFFGIDKAAMVQKLSPEIRHWYIGGHSFGGSMACMYAKDNAKKIEGVLLLGTYSGTDISKCPFKVRSINGTEDGIFTPEKIKAHKVELPEGAKITFITGMNHADIGNYGSQSGDKASKLADCDVISKLINATKDFFE